MGRCGRLDEQLRRTPRADAVGRHEERVLNVQDQLPETSRRVNRVRLVRANIHHIPASPEFPGYRIMIGRPGRLDDRAAERTVLPGNRPKGVIVPVDRAEVDIRIVPIPDKFDTDDLLPRVIKR